jgi:hypothetical protein
MIETYSDEYIHLDELERHWPDGREVPPLLKDLATFVRDQEYRSLGDFLMPGSRMDDAWIENGSDLWPFFGMFIGLPDGSRAALWFPEDGSPRDAPIVYLGSEGDNRIEAPNLEAFLAAWPLAAFDKKGALAAGGNKVSLPFELLRGKNEEAQNRRPALLAFLRERLGEDPSNFIRPPEPAAPLIHFLDAWGERERQRIASDPLLRAIAKQLDRYIPHGKELWQWETLLVRVSGGRCEIDTPEAGKKPLPGEKEVIPLVLEAREARAQGIHAVRGLWHKASIQLTSDGLCRILGDWAGQPIFRDGKPPSVFEIATDLKHFPRSDRWLEPWMMEAHSRG